MDAFEEEASSGDEVNNEESIYTVSDPVLDITTSSNPESFALRRGGAVDDLSQYGLDESNTKEENEPDETDIAEMSHIAQEIEDAEDFDLTIEIVDPAKSFIGVADPGDSTDSDTKIGGGEIATANRVLPEFSPRPRHRRTSASSSGRRSAERRRSKSLEKKRSLSRSSGRESVEKRRSGSTRRSGEVKEEPTKPAPASSQSSEKKQKSPRNADAEIDRHQRPSEEKENYKTPKRPASSFGCKKPSEKRRSGSLATSLLMEWSEKKTPSATLGLKADVSKHQSPSVAQKLLADWSPNPVQDCTIVTAEDRAQDRNSTSTSRKREMPVTAVPSRDAKSKRSL